MSVIKTKEEDGGGATSGQGQAVWIASYPKSGNTWVRVFINNLMREVSGGCEEAYSINSLEDCTYLAAYMGPLFVECLGKSLGEASMAEIAEVRTEVQARFVKLLNEAVYIKTHSSVANVDGFPNINFDITKAAVYIVRNPLDVTVSFARFFGVSLDAAIGFMANEAAGLPVSDMHPPEFLCSWSCHVASWISVPNRPVMILRYEDMLAEPEGSFGRLAGFLGLKPTTEQLRRAVAKSSFSELSKQEAEHGFLERPATAESFFRVGKAGQWREVLSQGQVEAIVSDHASMMMRCGYLPETWGNIEE